MTAFLSPSRQEVIDRHMADVMSLTEISITVELVQECICRHAGITRAELLSRNRIKRLAEPRLLAMYLAYDLTGRSLPQLATTFNREDHTTVMNARDRVRDRMASDPAYKLNVEQLRAAVVAVHREIAAQREKAISNFVRSPRRLHAV